MVLNAQSTFVKQNVCYACTMTAGKEEAEIAKDILRTFIDWKQISGFFWWILFVVVAAGIF